MLKQNERKRYQSAPAISSTLNKCLTSQVNNVNGSSIM